jgi:16S rRNA (guanine966-N2)-methyltransferase
MNSNLQIISGQYRGRRLTLPHSARPTQNRARIALFNMLGSLGVAPAVVWDAFAGSGALGLECLSRHPDAAVIFTDISAESFKVINKNAANIPNAVIEMTDALNAVERHGAKADLVFVDPPYSEIELGQSFVRKLARVAKPGAIVVWETESPTDPKFSTDIWTVLRNKVYGRARFLILKKIG